MCFLNHVIQRGKTVLPGHIAIAEAFVTRTSQRNQRTVSGILMHLRVIKTMGQLILNGFQSRASMKRIFGMPGEDDF